jgi:hypothetical protein
MAQDARRDAMHRRAKKLKDDTAHVASGAGMANNAVDGRVIAPLSVVNGHIGPFEIQNGRLAADSNDGRTTKAGSLANGHLEAFTLQNGRLADSAVDGRVLGPGAVANSHLGLDVVGNGNIVPLAIANGRLADNAVDGRTTLAGSLSNGHLAAFTIQNGRLADNAVDGRVLALDAVGSGHIRTSVVTLAKINDDAKGGTRAEYKLRILSGSGTSGQGASSDHSHSVSFKILTDEARKKILARREAVKKDWWAGRDGRVAPMRREITVLQEAVLSCMHMLCDDPDLSAEEREHLLVTDAGFRQHFEQTEMIHDHEHHGRRRRSERYTRETHPHIKEMA